MSAERSNLSNIDTSLLTSLLIQKVADYAIYLLTPEGVIATWNEGAERIKGYVAEEVIGTHFSRFYTDEGRQAGIADRALAIALSTGSFSTEDWRVRKDGSLFWASVVIDPIRSDDGQLLGYAKITRDISDKKAAQDAVVQNENQLRMLIQGVTDYALYMLSPTGHITNWNTGAERIKGYRADEIINTHFSRFYTVEDKAEGIPEHALATASRDGRYETEGWRVRKDGSRFRAHVIIDVIHDEAGGIAGFAKITRDITQRVQLEETKAALAQSQKLEAIGKLTGGVAHDFNNILQIISGSLQLLGMRTEGDESAGRYLNTALGAVTRGSKLASQLLAFARRQPLQPQVINAGLLIRASEDLLRRAIGEVITLETVVAGGLWNAQVDPHQLDIALLNLTINARDAMPEGGRLTIEASNAMLDDAYVGKLPDVPAGQYVVISVSDSGTGMSAEVMEKAVEPFYTTKPSGQGTGLGLSMVFGFVKQSNGHFRIYSEVGHGTVVKMYFPRSHALLTASEGTQSAEVIGGNETILVVEDDVALLEVVTELLRSLGYNVLEAGGPDEALRMLQQGIRCDLLFTDVVMPGTIKCTELAQHAQALLPGLPVLFTSGYTQNAIIHGGKLDHGVDLLSKPYRRDELARKVRRSLDKARGPTAPIVGSAERAKHVLLVEDEPDTSAVTAALLEALGYEIVAVSSAEQALELGDLSGFDILFTDFRLPGMNGVTLAAHLRELLPNMQLIVVSGDGRASADAAQAGAEFLRKPYNLQSLRDVLQKASFRFTS